MAYEAEKRIILAHQSHQVINHRCFHGRIVYWMLLAWVTLQIKQQRSEGVAFK